MSRQYWYMRRAGRVEGPYPAGQINSYVLLGRVSENDEVSTDQQQWAPLAWHPELIPEVMKADLNDPLARERLEAARRWADERRAQDRGPGPTQSGAGERRRPESAPIVRHRATRARLQGSSVAAPRPTVTGWLVLSLVIGLILAGGFYVYRERPQETVVRCDAPAVPTVNWSNCHLQGIRAQGAQLRGARITNADLTGADFTRAVLAGAELSYANASLADFSGSDLRHAVLVGVMLRGARLRDANLAGSDLSYANLSGADLRGANFTGVRLDHTIWVDQRLCSPGSIGRCLVVD